MASIYDNDGSPAYYVRKFYNAQKDNDKVTHWTRSIVREWGDGSEVNDTFLNELISDLAWRDRDDLASLDYYDEYYDESLSDSVGEFYYRVCVEALAQRYRFDFKYDDLYQLAIHADKSISNLILPFRAFGALGLGLSKSEEHVREALLSSRVTKASRYILLQGLYLGARLGKKQGDFIIELSNDMIDNGEENSTLYFWRAFGFKRLFRYEEALSCIDIAIGMLDGKEIGIHRDYSSERNSIVTCMIMRDQFADMLKKNKE